MKKKSIPASYHNTTWHCNKNHSIISTNPATKETLGKFGLCSKKDYLNMIKHAKKSQIETFDNESGWYTTSTKYRLKGNPAWEGKIESFKALNPTIKTFREK